MTGRDANAHDERAAVVRSELLAAVEDALRDHGSPLPDSGYPEDEYECCARELLDRFVLLPRDVSSSMPDLRTELATVLARGRRGVTARVNESDRIQADIVLAWLADYGLRTRER